MYWDFLNVISVIRFLLERIFLLIICWFILKLNNLDVIFVRGSIFRELCLLDIKEFIMIDNIYKVMFLVIRNVFND